MFGAAEHCWYARKHHTLDAHPVLVAEEDIETLLI